MVTRRNALLYSMSAALGALVVANLSRSAPSLAAGAPSDGLVRRMEQLEAQASQSAPPVGAVIAFPGEWPPLRPDGSRAWTEGELGWMLCDGRPLKAGEYPQLHRVLKQVHGSGTHDYSGTAPSARAGDFNLPDFRGYFLRGAAKDPGAESVDKGPRGRPHPDDGAATGVGSTQGWATALPKPSSGSTPITVGSAGDHTHLVSRVRRQGDGPSPGGAHFGWCDCHHETGTGPVDGVAASAGSHTHPLVGGDGESRPVNAAVHWVIKVVPSANPMP